MTTNEVRARLARDDHVEFNQNLQQNNPLRGYQKRGTATRQKKTTMTGAIVIWTEIFGHVENDHRTC